VWAGRIVFGLIVAALVVYLVVVGLEEADKVASGIGAVLALIALGAPYLLPPPGGGPEPDRVENSGRARATDGGRANTGVHRYGISSRAEALAMVHHRSIRPSWVGHSERSREGTKLTHVLVRRLPAGLAHTVIPELTSIAILTFELSRHQGPNGLPSRPPHLPSPEGPATQTGVSDMKAVRRPSYG